MQCFNCVNCLLLLQELASSKHPKPRIGPLIRLWNRQRFDKHVDMPFTEILFKKKVNTHGYPIHLCLSSLSFFVVLLTYVRIHFIQIYG